MKYNIFQVTFIFKEKKTAPMNPDKIKSPDLISEICALVQMMMSYLYCGGMESLKTNVPDLLEVRNTKQHIHTCVITCQFLNFYGLGGTALRVKGCLSASLSCCQLPACFSWGCCKDTVNLSALSTSIWKTQSASTRQPR